MDQFKVHKVWRELLSRHLCFPRRSPLCRSLCRRNNIALSISHLLPLCSCSSNSSCRPNSKGKKPFEELNTAEEVIEPDDVLPGWIEALVIRKRIRLGEEVKNDGLGLGEALLKEGGVKIYRVFVITFSVPELIKNISLVC